MTSSFGGEGAVFDDEGAFLALADLAAEILSLAVGHPGVFLLAGELACEPQHQGVDPAIGFAGGAARNEGAAAVSAPGPDPRLCAGFKLLDDGIGDALVGVLDALHCRLLPLVDGKKRDSRKRAHAPEGPQQSGGPRQRLRGGGAIVACPANHPTEGEGAVHRRLLPADSLCSL